MKNQILNDDQIEYLAGKYRNFRIMTHYEDEKMTLQYHNPDGFSLEWMLEDAYINGAKTAREMIKLSDLNF